MENLNNLEEIWKDIAGYEGYYQVSNLGRVKSLDRIIYRKDGTINPIKERILKLGNNSGGYLVISLFKDGKGKTYTIHRLVAQTFIDNPDNLPEVNHKDENKTNNNVSNLEWCTAKYNINYGTHNERCKKNISKSLTNHPERSKQIVQIDKTTGEIIKIWPSAAECRRNGFNQGNICSCCRGEQKTSKGYIWKFVDDVV